jgi:hypothetical protein
MQTLLDTVFERMTALFVRLIASHLEVKCAEHQAEVQCRVDELAAHYDQLGQAEVATHLRSLGQKLTTDAIVPSGEALLTQIQNQSPIAVANLPAAQAADSAAPVVRQRRSTSKRLLALADEPSALDSQADVVSVPQE